jgi:hypothetical protein
MPFTIFTCQAAKPLYSPSKVSFAVYCCSLREAAEAQLVAQLQQMASRTPELSPLARELLLEVEEGGADVELLAAEVASQVCTTTVWRLAGRLPSRP